MAIISATAFYCVARKSKVTLVTLNAIDDTIKEKLRTQLPDEEDLHEKLAKEVPSAYYDLFKAFSKRDSNTLAPHRPGVDH